MTLWRLVFKEIRLRRLSFCLSAALAAASVGLLVAHLSLLRAHDERTGQILEAKEAQTAAEMRRLEDDYRKIMKKLGFNLLVLPAGQRLDDFHAEGCATLDMPEDNVRRLADSGLMTIRHLLPSLEQKIRWPEQGQRRIYLAGVRGEFPMSHRAPKEPLSAAVEPGSAVLGFEIWDSLKLQKGDMITLLEKRFSVGRCNAQRGSKDDITLWIDLAEAQMLLDKPGRINAILALKCLCAGNEIVNIRAEIDTILPGVQIIELTNKVVTRAEARNRARIAAMNAIAEEKAGRARLRAERESFAAWVIPMVVLVAAAWIGLLALMNVRDRRCEIGLLRAVGFQARQIMGMFLGRAALVGLVGAGLGYALGFTLGMLAGETAVEARSAVVLFQPDMLVCLLIAAPLVAVLASWLPALIAARQDPALVLKDE